MASPSSSPGGPLHGVVGNRWASAGGGLGLVLVGLALVAVVGLAEVAPSPAASDEELEFLPGTLAKLGEGDVDRGDDSSQAPTPASAAVPELAAPEPSAPVVAVPETPATPSRPVHPRPTGGGTSLPKPAGGGGLPGPPAARGTPFGDPDGWDELTRSGDRWATEVLAAMNAMVVRPFGGDPGPGTVRFAITVCKDGRHTKIVRKGGDAVARTHDAVAIAVEQLVLPRIPAQLAATMRDDCMKIRYTFEWRDDRVQ